MFRVEPCLEKMLHVKIDAITHQFVEMNGLKSQPLQKGLTETAWESHQEVKYSNRAFYSLD